MPRGFDQPTSSSASRATNAGSREHSQQPSSIRTRQGRFEAPVTTPGAEDPKQPHLATPRRKPSNPPVSPPPQPPSESQPFPAGRKTPAYLQGKNPYGQVLDKVDHPYREPKAATTTAVSPAQAGSGIEAGLHVSDPSDSKPESLAQEPERRDPKTAPSSSRPQIPKSVRSAKEYFEARASQYQSTPLVPPPATGASRKSFTPKSQPLNVPHEVPTHVPSPKAPSTSEVASPEVGLLLPSLMDVGDTNESVQSVIPPTRAAADEHAPIITVGRATPPIDMSENEEQYGHDVEPESIGRRRSTNIFASSPQDAKPFGIDSQAANDSSAQAPIPEEPLVGNGDQSLVDKPDLASEAVRDLPTRSSVPAAETREAEPSNTQSQQEGRRAKSGRNLRRTFEEDQGNFSKRLRRSGSQTASLTEIGSSSKEPIDRVAKWTPSTDAKTSLYQPGKSVNVRRRAAEISSRNLGHDGASDFNFSRRSTVSSPVPTANIGVEEKYHEIEVPDDVDNRQGYGRRVTQDFGFPGARIKSHGTNRASRPLQDPGKWTKRACGHFSYMGKTEHRDNAQKKMCRQCSTRAQPAEELPATQRRTRRRALSESSTSIVSSPKPSNDNIRRKRKRRRHHSERIPPDKCGDAFAEELSYIIDNILEEHANTLQSVISNIRNSQPSVHQLRRVSGDLVQQCRTNSTCKQRCQPPCREHDDSLPTCVCILPKAAEKLNVGSPGQLKPNLNDPRHSLRDALQSIPDLVDLVNSAADDLGVDLERKPTATDDDMFRKAPYENTPRDSVSYHPDTSFKAIGDKVTDKEPATDDSWLQQTRRHLNELSEARKQLMDKLDSITGDLEVQLQDQQETKLGDESIVNPVQRVLNKASTRFSHMSTLHQDALVESVQRMLDSASTSPSRDEDAVDDLVIEPVQRVPGKTPIGASSEEIWEALRVARNEIPDAGASVTDVLQTLPGTGYGLDDEAGDVAELDRPVELIAEARCSPWYGTRLEVESEISATPVAIQEGQHSATRQRCAAASPIPQLVEQGTRTLSSASPETTPPEYFASRLRRRLSEVEVAMSSRNSENRLMSPDPESPRVVSSVSSPRPIDMPPIETVRCSSPRKATLKRSRQATAREPDRTASPPGFQDQKLDFLPPVQRICRMSTVSPEPARVFLRRDSMEGFRRRDTFSGLASQSRSPQFVDEPESGFLPPVQGVRGSTAVPLVQQRRVMAQSSIDEGKEDSGTCTPVRQMSRVNTVTPPEQRRASIQSPLEEEQDQFEFLPPVQRIRRPATVLERKPAWESSIALNADEQKDEESGFLPPVERMRKATTGVPLEQPQEREELERSASSSESEYSEPLLLVARVGSGFQPLVERIRRIATLSPGYQSEPGDLPPAQQIRRTTTASRQQSLVADEQDSEFVPPVQRIRRTTTVAPAERQEIILQHRRDDLIAELGITLEVSFSDEDEPELQLMPVCRTTAVPPGVQQPIMLELESNTPLDPGSQPAFERIHRKITVVPDTPTHKSEFQEAEFSSSAEPAIMSSYISPIVEEIYEQPVSSRVASRRPTLQGRRTSTMPSSSKRQDSMRFISSPVAEDLADEPVSHIVSRQPTQAGRRNKARSAVSRKESPGVEKSPALLLAENDGPNQVSHPVERRSSPAVRPTSKFSAGKLSTSPDLTPGGEGSPVPFIPRRAATRQPTRRVTICEAAKAVLPFETPPAMEDVPATSWTPDTESFEPYIYQRVAEEPLNKENDSSSQRTTLLPEDHGREDLIRQAGRAPTAHFSPTLELVAHADAGDQPGQHRQLGTRMMQASREIQPGVPRILTIPNGSHHRRSSDAANIAPPAADFVSSVDTDVESPGNENPLIERRMTRIPTGPRTADRRRSSAAPGITAPPPETFGKQTETVMQPRSPKQKPKKVANYPPEQQYPPAPAYPLRDTPSWTKPDTQTPSPKPKAESLHKKRGWLRIKPKPQEPSAGFEVESPSRRPSQLALDPSSVRPFRDAAPGSPKVPGGTQKRQKSYPSQVRRSAYRRDSDVIPLRRADTRSRQTSVYACKDDYYPIAPILPDRIDDGTQLQSSPSRKNSYSVHQAASAIETSCRDEPQRQSTRRLSSGPSRRRSQPRHIPRTQTDVPVSTQASEFQAGPDTKVQVPRTVQESREEDTQCPIRRDVHKPTDIEGPAAKEESAPRESTQPPERRQSLSRVPPKEGPSNEGKLDRSPSRVLEVPSTQALQKQAQKPTRRPRVPRGEESNARTRKKMVLDGDPAPAEPRISQGEQDISIRCGIDRSGERSDEDHVRISTTFGLSRSKTSRKTPTRDEGDQRRLSATSAGEEAPIAREDVRRATAGGARNNTASGPAGEGPTAATRRPSSSVKRTKTRCRSSATREDRVPIPARGPAGTRTPLRTATIASSAREADSRRPFTTPRAGTTVSRAALPDNDAEPIKGGGLGTPSQQERRESASPVVVQPDQSPSTAPGIRVPVSRAALPGSRSTKKGGDGPTLPTSQGLLGAISPSPAFNTGSKQYGPQPAEGSLAMNQRADPGAERQSKAGPRPDPSNVNSALPHRVTSYGMYESSSNDPYAMPISGLHKAGALASSNANANVNASPATHQADPRSQTLARRDSLKPRRSPTPKISEFFGREKADPEIGSQQQQKQPQAPAPAVKPPGAVMYGSELTPSGTVKEVEASTAMQSSQPQQPQRDMFQGMAVQGADTTNLIRGRWGWGWAK